MTQKEIKQKSYWVRCIGLTGYFYTMQYFAESTEYLHRQLDIESELVSATMVSKVPGYVKSNIKWAYIKSKSEPKTVKKFLRQDVQHYTSKDVGESAREKINLIRDLNDLLVQLADGAPLSLNNRHDDAECGDKHLVSEMMMVEKKKKEAAN